MKIRNDFVTNSSSSSFIISNNTDETLSSEEFVMKLFEGILEDAKNRFVIEPGKSLTIVCGDSASDGAFENFIHNTFSSWGPPSHFDIDAVSVEFDESYH